VEISEPLLHLAGRAEGEYAGGGGDPTPAAVAPALALARI